MTIKVTITNSDTRESAIIDVIVVEAVDLLHGRSVTTLKCGESCESYVHQGESLVVSEVSQ